MTDSLGKLFGSPARVKLLRLFAFNPELVLDITEIAKRVRTTKDSTRRELARLERAGFLKRRVFYRSVSNTRKKKKVKGFVLNNSFPFLSSLTQFLIDTAPLEDKEILGRLKSAGRLKLVIASGVLTDVSDSRIDLLIVGERVRASLLENAIRAIEADIGRELRCAVLSLHDFKYRMSVYDRLVRDVLDYPHRTLLDRVGIEKKEVLLGGILQNGKE